MLLIAVEDPVFKKFAGNNPFFEHYFNSGVFDFVISSFLWIVSPTSHRFLVFIYRVSAEFCLYLVSRIGRAAVVIKGQRCERKLRMNDVALEELDESFALEKTPLLRGHVPIDFLADALFVLQMFAIGI